MHVIVEYVTAGFHAYSSLNHDISSLSKNYHTNKSEIHKDR